MRNDLVVVLLKYRAAQVALLLLIVMTVWWFSLSPFVPSDLDSTVHARYIWGSLYQLIALWGALCGMYISRLWGGVYSVIGRCILAFSFGLLLQVFGQSVYSYYNLFAQIEAPYPSLGDVGYFGSIFVYLYGAVLLAKASGVHVSLRSYRSQALAFLLPSLLLVSSYFIFLGDYEFDWEQLLKITLDFGYPLLQACYVSVAILTLLLSRKVLGGLMRPAIILLLIALIAQYIADFNFLYQVNQMSWYVGGYGDYLYTFSYFCMTIALIYIGYTFSKIERS